MGAIAVVDQYGGGPHSEQQVLDCYAPNGCATVAQTPNNALNYLLTAGSTEAGAYKYNNVAPTQGTCHNYPPSQHVTNVLTVGASAFSMEQALQLWAITMRRLVPSNRTIGLFATASAKTGVWADTFTLRREWGPVALKLVLSPPPSKMTRVSVQG